MNIKKTKKDLVNFIRHEIKKTNLSNFVVGISGGVDSAVVSALCSNIKDTEVFGLIMPTKRQENNIQDAVIHCKNFGIKYEVINIENIKNIFLKTIPQTNNHLLGNIIARIRMILLYDYSAKKNAVVVGTSNLSERILGYGTIYGDLSYAFNPIGAILKTDIFKLAYELGISDKIIKKAPSADLFDGQTDEKDIGFSYKDIDEILRPKVSEINKKLSKNNTNFDTIFYELRCMYETDNNKLNILNLIQQRFNKNKFKLKMPQVANKINM